MKGNGQTLELVKAPGKASLLQPREPEPLAVTGQTSSIGNVRVADEAGLAYLSGDIDFGATGRNEIFQNIKFVVLTEYFSVPLDREFGFDYSMVDKPMAIAEAVFSQEVAMRISLYEPRAQFRSIEFTRDEMVGKLSPNIQVALLTLEEGPSLYRASIQGGAGAVAAPTPTPAVIATPETFSGTITGLPGAQGPAGTVVVGTTTTGAPGTDALVVNTGTPSAAVLDFTIPEGEKGEQGTGINVKGTVANHASLPSTGNQPGDMWIASDTGHGWSWNGTVWVDCGPIQGPTGPPGPTGPQGSTGATGATGTAATVAVGSTITGAAGTSASVANVGSSSAAIFNFTIPQGIQGVQGVQGPQGNQGIQGPTGMPATVAVGTTTTGAAGSSATVTNTGTASAAVLNFTIPQGIKGDQGTQGVQGPAGPANVLSVQSTTTGAAGTNANVTIAGTTPTQSLAFTIPRGDVGAQGIQGPQGPAGTYSLARNYLAGLTIANGTDAVNDININIGKCRDDLDVADIVLVSILTKQLDVAWAAGTNAGGRDTGAISDATWHMFAIKNPTTGVCDVLFSLSVSAPTLPSGYTQKRRIGSLVRRTGALLPFVQMGDYFQYPTPYADINGAAQTPNQSGPSLVPSIPAGMKFLGHFVTKVTNNTAGAGQAQVRDPDQGSTIQGTHSWTGAGFAVTHVDQIWTSPNPNATLLLWAQTTPASSVTTYYVTTLGYWDYRGKQD